MESLEPVPHLAGSASAALRFILMIFGSGVSAFLAAYCGHQFEPAENATTLTMAVIALCALSLYLFMLRGIRGGTRQLRAV